MGNCLANNTIENQNNMQALKAAEEREFEGVVTYIKPFYKGIVVRSAPTVQQLDEIFARENELKQIKNKSKQS